MIFIQCYCVTDIHVHHTYKTILIGLWPTWLVCLMFKPNNFLQLVVETRKRKDNYILTALQISCPTLHKTAKYLNFENQREAVGRTY